jgi:hypothetical protein
MKQITRGELGDILSAQTATRTIHNKESEKGQEINDNWIVVFIENDSNGIMTIYCESDHD